MGAQATARSVLLGRRRFTVPKVIDVRDAPPGLRIVYRVLLANWRCVLFPGRFKDDTSRCLGLVDDGDILAQQLAELTIIVC